RDPSEAPLVRRALERLTATGAKVAVSDGGSLPEFAEFLRKLPALSLVPPDAPGLVGQVRASLREAARAQKPFVMYTEPDKDEFFEMRLAEFVADAPEDDDVGVVLASRDRESFATFPPFQRHTESVFNATTASLLGAEGDYCYGPCLIRSSLTQYLERVPDTVGWGWRPFLFATAHRLGYRLVHTTRWHPCPVEQRVEHDADRLHRLRQLRQNVDGLLLALDQKPLP